MLYPIQLTVEQVAVQSLTKTLSAATTAEVATVPKIVTKILAA